MDSNELDTIIYTCHILRKALSVDDCDDAVQEGFQNADHGLEWALDAVEDLVFELDEKDKTLKKAIEFISQYDYEDGELEGINKEIFEEIDEESDIDLNEEDEEDEEDENNNEFELDDEGELECIELEDGNGEVIIGSDMCSEEDLLENNLVLEAYDTGL